PLFLTVGAGGSDLRYRILARPASSFGTLVVAIPLQDVEETLKRLTILEVLVGIAVLSGVGIISALVVRRGLQPLEAIAATAGEIAGGDLGKRVDAPEDRTEIGSLGSALNSMLSRIESAFAQKEASEQRLRRFVADASHELRTPLTSIRGYAELFRRGADVRPDDLAKSMQRIEQESLRMGQMVEELLQLARLDEGRPLDFQEVDLVAIVRDLAGDTAAVAPEWALSVEAPDSLLVQGDDSSLRQVVSNLINNAVTHTPAGTAVRVTLKTSGEEAVLEVADEGPGMEDGHAQKIFDRFYRVDKARSRDKGGFGLGLSIVAAIVEAHGGRVAASSEAGRGSTFTVSLPLGQREDRYPKVKA
ncbi:MAG: sensor histidine kinase, partial [Actinomycetota bacterium]